MDSVVEKKTFGGKMKNAFSGIITGFIMILIGIGLLIWNERRNVINIKDVAELRDNYVEINSDSVDASNNGKLVVTANTLDFGNEVLLDEIFKVSAETPLLRRTVEVYEWEEEVQEDDNSTTYNYNKKWSTELINSADFKNSNGHQNPSALPYDSEDVKSEYIKVGAYKLSEAFRSSLDTNKDVSNFDEAKIPEGYKVYNKYITNSEDPANPEVGDIRISFSYTSYPTVTVLGKVNDDTIGEYITKKKSKISYLVEGKHDGEYVIDSIEKTNNFMKWLLRLIGTLLIIFGFNSLFGPLTTLTSYVPILGNLVGGALFLVSFLVGLAVSLLVIAISWIVFRPLLGICLLVVVALLIILAKKFLGKKKTVETSSSN